MLSAWRKFTFAIMLLCLPAVALAQQIAIGQYNVPTPDAEPQGIALGPDGALWFTEYNVGNIGRITTAGTVTEYLVPTAYSYPVGITAGPDGALWFAENGGNNIGRITTAGVITEFPLPNYDSHPYGITAGRDGAIWFTEAGNMGRITTAGVITQYPLPDGTGSANAIVTGPDGALWFSQGVGSRPAQIARVTTAGATTVYTPFTSRSTIGALAIGPDGALWFGTDTCEIGSITTAGTIASYPVSGCGNGSVSAITEGPDGAMWFLGPQGNLGRITTSGAITLYPSGTGFSAGITVGPDGELWFTSGEDIAEAFFVTANLSVSPDTGFSQTNRTFTGSGFAPGETVRIYAHGVGSAALANPAGDATGAFTVGAQLPNSPYGAQIYVGVGLSSHKLGAANYTVTPALVLNPNSGPVGTTVTVEGSGFPSRTGFWIYWSALDMPLGVANTDANGVFDGGAAVTFTVPAGAAPGANRVEAAFNCTGGRTPTCPDSGGAFFTVQ
jgi:virginiamycin B lyase